MTRNEKNEKIGNDEETGLALFAEGDETFSSVYITTSEGDEIASISGEDWTEDRISALIEKYGVPMAKFRGGTLDGFEAI